MLYRSGNYRSIHPLPVEGPYQNEGTFPQAIDCPAVGHCAALTEMYDGADLLSMRNGTWAATPAAPPGGAIANTIVRVRVLSCASAEDCVAVGDVENADSSPIDTRVLIFQLHDGSWTSSYAPVPVPDSDAEFVTYRVSCPTVTYCGALATESKTSYFVQITSSGTTVQQLPPAPKAAVQDQLDDLDCAAANRCTFVDQTASYLLTSSGSSLTAHVVPSLPGVDLDPDDSYSATVTCPSASTCFALGIVSGTKEIVRLRGSTVTAYSIPEVTTSDGRSFISMLSCPEVDYCVAAGGRGEPIDHARGVYDVFSNGVWTPGQFASVAGQPTVSDLDPADLDCAAPSACFVTGSYGYDRTYDSDSGEPVWKHARALTIAQG